MKWWWQFTLQNHCFRLSVNSGHILKVILQLSDYFSFSFYTAVRPCGLQGCNCIPMSLFSLIVCHQKFQLYNFNMETIKKCFGAVVRMLLACIPQWHWQNSYTIHDFECRQETGKQITICLLPPSLPALSSPPLPWGSLSVWSWRKLLCTC